MRQKKTKREYTSDPMIMHFVHILECLGTFRNWLVMLCAFFLWAAARVHVLESYVCVCQLSKTSIFGICCFFFSKWNWAMKKKDDKTACCRFLMLLLILFVCLFWLLKLDTFFGARFRCCSSFHFFIFAFCMFLLCIRCIHLSARRK